MNRSEHQKQKVNTFHKGANSDLSPNLYDSDDGYYLDATNLRLGNDKVLTKVGGEFAINISEIDNDEYPDSAYKCIGSCKVLGTLIEVWADSSVYGYPSIITVDGVIMVRSPLFDVVSTHPLQMDVNESCVGGEFAFTDFRVLPFLFNLGDIIEKHTAGLETYFNEFDPQAYQVVLSLNITPPKFISLYTTTSGMRVGVYTYAMRYVDTEGNKTQWSPATPTIPVIYSYNSNSPKYPYSKTYGNLNVVSGFGIQIDVRVVNDNIFSYVELKREKYINNGAIDTPPEIETYIMPNDISTTNQDRYQVITFQDSSDIVWEAYSQEEEAANETTNLFARAKAIRFYDKRLCFGNVDYPTKDIEEVIAPTIDGVTGFNVIEKLGVIGHSDPYNMTYFKSEQTGEKYNWAVQLYDTSGGKSLVVPIDSLEGFQNANRRDEMTGDSLLYSHTEWKGAVQAANTDNEVSRTFELFDLADAVKRTVGTHISISDNDDGDTELSYNPLTPIAPTSLTVTGLGLQICEDAQLTGGTQEYNPQGFAPNYFSMGMALKGLKSIDGWSGFSVMKSKKANRVICQGIGTYALYRPDDKLAKYKRKMWCHFPDIESGNVTEVSIQALIAAGGCKIEIVSPLGFFSEPYAWDYQLVNGTRNIDFISYARILREDGTINSGLTRIDNASTYYSKFGQWRNQLYADPIVTPAIKKIYGVEALTRTIDGDRGAYKYLMEVDDDIYQLDIITSDKVQGDTDQAKNFHEPFYIINIISENAEVTVGNINEYNYCGNYQSFRTKIGIGIDSIDVQEEEISFKLVSERWEDSCVNPYATDLTLQNVYVWVEDSATSGTYKRWLNITNKTTAQKEEIYAALNVSDTSVYTDTDGNDIFGVYTNTNTSDRVFEIVFSPNADINFRNKYLPQKDKLVQVRFDDRYPIKIFGGDRVIAENIFCPLDGLCDAQGNVVDDRQFTFDFPMPYYGWEKSSYYHIMKNTTAVGGANWQSEGCTLNHVRQWVIMYACETQFASNLCWGLDSSGGSTSDVTAGINNRAFQSFPQIHYIQRPQDWETDDYSTNFSDTRVKPQYLVDFPREHYEWGYGGFRWNKITSSTFNNDYLKLDKGSVNIEKPKVGWVENTRFCSRVIWSEKRDINEQDDPNLKTYPAANVYDIEDNQGEIKYLFDNDSNKGNNLIAFTEKGICVLLTNKSIVSGANGDDLTTTSSEGFINPNSEVWLNKEVGVNDEMWRSIAEHSDICFFANNTSSYLLRGTELIDILRNIQGGYNYILLPILKAVNEGYTDKVSCVYDKKNDEYWLSINDKQYVFNNQKDVMNWIGKYTYVGDKYICLNNDVLASKAKSVTTEGVTTKYLNTFLLNEGYTVDGSTLAATLEIAISPEPYESKEAIDVDVFSNYKPTSVTISDNASYTNSSTLSSSLGTRYLRDFGGHFYGFIPRRIDSPNARLQNVYFYMKLIHSAAEKFVVRMIKTGYKILK